MTWGDLHEGGKVTPENAKHLPKETRLTAIGEEHAWVSQRHHILLCALIGEQTGTENV